MSLDFTDDQSTLVQVMAWCRQATSHYLSQCWPRSVLPYGVIRPQWTWTCLITMTVSFSVPNGWVTYGVPIVRILEENQPYDKKTSCMNLQRPSEYIWHDRFRSILAQVMACCLTVSSHYLKQCWLIMTGTLWHSPVTNFTRNVHEVNA